VHSISCDLIVGIISWNSHKQMQYNWHTCTESRQGKACTRCYQILSDSSLNYVVKDIATLYNWPITWFTKEAVSHSSFISIMTRWALFTYIRTKFICVIAFLTRLTFSNICIVIEIPGWARCAGTSISFISPIAFTMVAVTTFYRADISKHSIWTRDADWGAAIDAIWKPQDQRW
jgi:hypothetical protein